MDDYIFGEDYNDTVYKATFSTKYKIKNREGLRNLLKSGNSIKELIKDYDEDVSVDIALNVENPLSEEEERGEYRLYDSYEILDYSVEEEKIIIKWVVKYTRITPPQEPSGDPKWGPTQNGNELY